MDRRAFKAPHLTLIGLVAALSACSTVPESKVTWHRWPKSAYLGVPEREFEKLGQVRTRIEYNSLDFDNDETKLCKNYFNKAAADLLKRAKEVGADAIIDVRSVVFQIDGKFDTFETPECTDDGIEGQVLAQAVAVKWKRDRNGKILGGGKPIRRTYSQKAREAKSEAPVYAPKRRPANAFATPPFKPGLGADAAPEFPKESDVPAESGSRLSFPERGEGRK